MSTGSSDNTTRGVPHTASHTALYCKLQIATDTSRRHTLRMSLSDPAEVADETQQPRAKTASRQGANGWPKLCVQLMGEDRVRDTLTGAHHAIAKIRLNCRQTSICLRS